MFILRESRAPGVAVAAAADAEVLGFGPFDEVLEAEDGFGDECPEGGVLDAEAPVVEFCICVDLRNWLEEKDKVI